jgi:hypothetical protein
MGDEDLDRDRDLQRRCRREVRARVPRGTGPAAEILDEDPAGAAEGTSKATDRLCEARISTTARRGARVCGAREPEDRPDDGGGTAAPTRDRGDGEPNIAAGKLDPEVEPPSAEILLGRDPAADADDDPPRSARSAAGDSPERDLVRRRRDQLGWRKRRGQRATGRAA